MRDVASAMNDFRFSRCPRFSISRRYQLQVRLGLVVMIDDFLMVLASEFGLGFLGCSPENLIFWRSSHEVEEVSEDEKWFSGFIV